MQIRDRLVARSLVVVVVVGTSVGHGACGGGVGATDASTSSRATTASLSAVADSYVKSGTPNQPQGSSAVVRVQDAGNNRALVRFDEGQIAVAVGAETLVSATVELSIVDNGDNWGSVGRTLDLHRVTTAWTEAGATWNCAIDANP
ncbi:MAG: DNRLRE domain-containing protein, partial [Deltaproteobacteria bacterium]|nr:DNRLRE domain-containing protein [Deltaproteobacteria bacterium]